MEDDDDDEGGGGEAGNGGHTGGLGKAEINIPHAGNSHWSVPVDDPSSFFYFIFRVIIFYLFFGRKKNSKKSDCFIFPFSTCYVTVNWETDVCGRPSFFSFFLLGFFILGVYEFCCRHVMIRVLWGGNRKGKCFWVHNFCYLADVWLSIVPIEGY
jgi:hypothetical protein